MIQGAAQPQANGTDKTVWGLTPAQLHDRFWASRGVQVVRQGERSEIVRHAEFFLLMSPQDLVITRLAPVLDTLAWLEPALTTLRLYDTRPIEYQEYVSVGGDMRFEGYERVYKRRSDIPTRVGLVRDKELVDVWQHATDARVGWTRLRRLAGTSRYSARLDASVYSADDPDSLAQFMRDLVQRWRRPDATIRRIRNLGDGVWIDRDADVTQTDTHTGPLWIGAGRSISESTSAVGPAVAWDSPDARPSDTSVEWQELEPLSATIARSSTVSKRATTPLKRAFDIVFSLVALLLTAPIYPIVALIIWIEDGRPIFFRHRRETVGGREFGCIKFRSMRNDAEAIKASLQAQNQADGPQFFIENDPRLTRIGRLIRELQIDELPQFWNVLKGDMSIVGPRPSPYKENQFCPPWREARLSVRPGITGLWQISRTRAEGEDFQEWIKYDIQYVERRSFRLDLYIIWQTIWLVIKKVIDS